ncbi:Minor extracellular protease vpr 2 [Colletotrichum truncatum]|uniref:Minor extracellular protease vpr 2 n=1 Tax=Colletotrichum truncatum TaxID=5467 RepID=A0ACC3YWQ5_COLTU|nr:Minor extracellular protease vpr 2 [Colletotrichum truncatum]KAF6787550.1 Minor extracellular protease vpr 2 [Colletotrichum truncatum]
MRLSPLLWAVALGVVKANSLHRHRGTDDSQNSTVSGTKKFIIEAEPGVALTDLSRKIEATGAKILKSFNSEIFSGLSIESEDDNLDTLQTVQEVAQAWPVKTYRLSPVTPQASFSDDATAQNWSIHYSTGVDKVHQSGVFGKGVKVAVIDSGVDYNHPALGGGFGPGFKVSGGYDLVGQEYDGSNDKIPDEDPLDALGHGTHVAGIIAGKSDFYAGVAPEAEILAFKVFGAVDGTDEDTLIDATIMAYESGADIITASIGRAAGFSDGPWATVASRIVEQGVVVTIAAGNDGDEGPFYASSGSSGKEVLAVASVDTSRVPSKPWHATFNLDGKSNRTQLAYIPPVNRPAWNVSGLPIVPLSFDTKITGEACSPLPDTTPDLSNVIVLIRRGSCTPYVKQTNVEKFGAQYVLFYNDDYRPFELVANSAYKSQMALIDAKAGAAIIETIKAGGNVTADFTNPDDPNWAVGFFDAAGGIPSQYSSWGGTYELEIKPDIAAPGANIYSTYLGKTWKVLSGTSMATPYVAGVAALYISKHGGRSVHGKGFAKELSKRIISSGESLPWQVIEPQALPVDFGYFAPVTQVGNGLINATKLLESTTFLSFDKIALNDTGSFSRYHKVNITNSGDQPVTYSFSLQPAGGFNAQGRTPRLLADVLDIKPIGLVPEVGFPSGTFKVNPGETKQAQFNFMFPKVDDESKLPIYSGKVLISSSKDETLSIPYLGAAFNLKVQMRGKMFPDGYPIQRSGPNGQDIKTYHTYGFNTSRVAQDFPKVYTQLKWGTKELRWDIFDAEYTENLWKYPPVVGQDGYIGAVAYSTYSVRATTFDPATMDKEKVLPFPIWGVERTTSWSELTDRFWWFGKMANGSYIAPGNYTMRFAALTPFSNPAHSDNWHIWSTPQVTILPYSP